MIELKKYQNSDKKNWDNFLDKSRIDTFLFKRDFMDYHDNRFNDYSFIIYRKNKIEALIPGNITNKIFYSHEGLTYGGLISSNQITLKDTLQIFIKLNDFLKNEGIQEVIYKPTPHIYHKSPSEEDLYTLFMIDAKRIACNISSTIFQHNKISFIESRKSGIRKALKNGVIILESDELTDFWTILEDNLKYSYNKKPVHSLIEIKKLKNSFPEQIRFHGGYINNCLIGGALLFVMKYIVHVQYISANEMGKKTGVLDLLFHELINKNYVDYPIFDFGQSTEQNGNYLNEGLIFQKEGFGGRGVVYETFKYKL